MKNTTLAVVRLVMGCALALGLLPESSFAQPGPPSGGGCTNCPGSFVQNTNRNYIKYLNHAFSLIDTNVAALADTNLYDALLTFPVDTNTVPNLQVMLYGTNTLLLRANHFDYSTETTRDFALLICDKAETPVWKNIDFFNTSDAQDGWLVQGSVPHWEVKDVMYFKISDYAKDCNAFFRAIPYGGAEISFISPQPYDVVSNTISIQTTVLDLSGITNEQFEVNVDGGPARYTLTTNGLILLNTKYTPEGPVNVYLKTINKAHVSPLTNLPDNSKIFFSSLVVLPLDFENDTYLLFASDLASPDIGTNYFYFVTDKPQTITASIFNPANGNVLKSFYGYVPFGATIGLAWNFTEANGMTAYTNDTYAVEFHTSNPTDLYLTNKIERYGVRQGTGCFISYQEEKPGDNNGDYWNTWSYNWLHESLPHLYEDQYHPMRITQYSPSQVGTNRNKAKCVALTPATPVWADFMSVNLANPDYSDLNIGGAHCNGYDMGYSKAYLPNKFTTYQLRSWISSGNFFGSTRLRKTAIWGCFSGAETGDLEFYTACGIYNEASQMAGLSKKNAGIFFANKLPQLWVTGGMLITTAQASMELDLSFICGKFPVPGSCDPTYSIRWAFAATMAHYPEMDTDPDTGKTGLAKPVLRGFPKLIHTTVYDNELTLLDFTHVKEN